MYCEKKILTIFANSPTPPQQIQSGLRCNQIQLWPTHLGRNGKSGAILTEQRSCPDHGRWWQVILSNKEKNLKKELKKGDFVQNHFKFSNL